MLLATQPGQGADCFIGPAEIPQGATALSLRLGPMTRGASPLPGDPGGPQQEAQHQCDQRGGLARLAASEAPELRRHADSPSLDRAPIQEAPEVFGEGGGGLVSLAWLLGDRLQADRLQVARDPAIEPPRRSR